MLTTKQELLDRTDTLSIHQMIAYQTAVSTLKIIKSGKPTYIAMKMKGRRLNMVTRQGASRISVPGHKLNIHVVFFIRNHLIRKSGSKSHKIKKKTKKQPRLKKDNA